MQEDFTGPPPAAQSPHRTGRACLYAAIKKQWLRDRRWFEARPWRELRARRMTPADYAEILARGYRLNDIPPNRLYAILILRSSAEFHVFRPASVTLDAARRLARMDDAEIRAWEADRTYSFFCPVLVCLPGDATFGFARDYQDPHSDPNWAVPCEARRRSQRQTLAPHYPRA